MSQTRATSAGIVRTAQDLRLERFLELKERARTVERELEQLKAEIIHAGTHTTENFAVIVEQTETVRAPGKEVLLKEFGEAVSRLFVRGIRTDIRIAKLGGA